MDKAWRGFTGTKWLDEVNVRQFIQDNYDSYDGDASFLEEPTAATNKLWGMLKELQKQERAKGGVLDMETEVVSSMTSETCFHALWWYQDGRTSMYNLWL